jgi:hypothetical protein
VRSDEVEEVYNGVGDFLVGHVKLRQQRQEGSEVGSGSLFCLLRAQSIFDCAEHDSRLESMLDSVTEERHESPHLLHARQLGLRPDLVEPLVQRHSGRHDVCTIKSQPQPSRELSVLDRLSYR